MSPAEWPERPRLRFLLKKILRRDELCLTRGGLRCPHIEQGEERCLQCPLSWMDRAMEGDAGRLIRRTLFLDRAKRIGGVTLTLADIRIDELAAIEALEQEREALERERHQAGQNGAIPNQNQ